MSDEQNLEEAAETKQKDLEQENGEDSQTMCEKCSSGEDHQNASMERDCAEMRTELARLRSAAGAMDAQFADRTSSAGRRHRREVKKLLAEEERAREGSRLAEQMERLMQHRRVQILDLARENEELRKEIEETARKSEETQEKIELEMTKTLKLRARLKKRETGLKGAYGHEEESYIEIIV